MIYQGSRPLKPWFHAPGVWTKAGEMVQSQGATGHGWCITGGVQFQLGIQSRLIMCPSSGFLSVCLTEYTYILTYQFQHVGVESKTVWWVNGLEGLCSPSWVCLNLLSLIHVVLWNMLVTGPFLVSCSLTLTPGVSKQTSPIFRGLDALRFYYP